MTGLDCGGSIHRCLHRRAALAVDGRGGNRLGPPGDECRDPADGQPLLSDLGRASHLHVLYLGGIDTDPADEAVQDVGRQVVRTNLCESPVAASDRRAYGVDDEGVSHRRSVSATAAPETRDGSSSLSEEGSFRKESAMAAVATGVEEQLLIGGKWVDAADGRRFDVTDPGTGEIVGSVPDAGEAEVAAAIDAAAAALDEWKSQPALNRARTLRRAADLIRERSDRIGLVMTSEQGKPLAEAKGEVEYAASFLEWFAGEAERVYGQVVPSMNPANRTLVLRQPVGVVAAITPWNFPAAMMTRKLGPAMAAGCTSVVKPASATPLTAALILRAIEDAGPPPGVVNLNTSRSAGMVAEQLFSDARVRKISSTGSTEVGKDLIRRSADQIKRLSLELGGHAPYIIFDDADLEEALDGTIASKFRNAGQTCICANRIYVQRGIHDAFLDGLARRIAALAAGPGRKPGVTIGPLIDEAGVAKAETHVRDAVEHGARLVVGGERLSGGEYAGGSYYAPTVLDGVTPEMLISHEETFG